MMELIMISMIVLQKVTLPKFAMKLNWTSVIAWKLVIGNLLNIWNNKNRLGLE